MQNLSLSELNNQITKLSQEELSTSILANKLLELRYAYIETLKDSISMFEELESETNVDSVSNQIMDNLINDAYFRKIQNNGSKKSVNASVELIHLLSLKSHGSKDITRTNPNKQKVKFWQESIKSQEEAIVKLKVYLSSELNKEKTKQQNQITEAKPKSNSDELYNTNSIVKQIIIASIESGIKYELELSKDPKSFKDRQAFMSWPLVNSMIKDRFSGNGKPMVFISDQSLVQSVCQGQVIYAKKLGPNNYTIVLMHSDNYYTVYSRLSSAFVSYGQKILYQESLGSASLNNSGKNELQFEVWKGSKNIDPIHWLKNG